jgi:hypothetical protein
MLESSAVDRRDARSLLQAMLHLHHSPAAAGIAVLSPLNVTS